MFKTQRHAPSRASAGQGAAVASLAAILRSARRGGLLVLLLILPIPFLPQLLTLLVLLRVGIKSILKFKHSRYMRTRAARAQQLRGSQGVRLLATSSAGVRDR